MIEGRLQILLMIQKKRLVTLRVRCCRMERNHM